MAKTAKFMVEFDYFGCKQFETTDKSLNLLNRFYSQINIYYRRRNLFHLTGRGCKNVTIWAFWWSVSNCRQIEDEQKWFDIVFDKGNKLPELEITDKNCDKTTWTSAKKNGSNEKEKIFFSDKIRYSLQAIAFSIDFTLETILFYFIF